MAIDADSKLAVNWLVGQRNWKDCWQFIDGIKKRVSGRIQLSTDNHASYRGAVGLVFEGDVDWATIQGLPLQTGRSRLAIARLFAWVSKPKTRLGSPDLRQGFNLLCGEVELDDANGNEAFYAS